MQPQYFLVFAGEHTAVFRKDGWTKDQIRRYCFDHTQTSHAELKRIQIMPGAASQEDETTMRSLVQSPEDFVVVAAGGSAGAFSAYIPGWGGKKTSQA